MLSILIVEDDDTNLEVLEFFTIEYFKDKNIKIHIDLAINGLEALGYLSLKKYDLILLDVLMPKCDGFRVLNALNLKFKDNKPYICMVTGLGEKKHKFLFELKGANSYVIKPFEKDKILKVFDDFTNKLDLDVESKEEFSDFYDDFDDFDDFDNLDLNEMDNFNKSHKKVSAEEFLSGYDDISYLLDEINDIDYDIDELLQTLDLVHFENNIEEINFIISKYISFLNNFIDFEELSISLNLVATLLNKIHNDIDNNNKILILEYLKTIIEDIYDWKEHVFVLQDAVDIFYINASILANSKQFEYFLNKITS